MTSMLPSVGEILTDPSYLKNILKSLDYENTWNLEYSTNGLSIWSKCSNNNDIKTFKALAFFRDVSASTLFDVLMDSDYRKLWDKNMIDSYEVCQVNDNSDIGYYSLRSFPGIKNRDFVLQRCWTHSEAEYITATHSVFHKALPPFKQFIRALTYINAYIIRVHDTSSCELVYITQCDPRGRIPIWVINKSTQYLAPRVIKRLIKAAHNYASWKKNNRPDFKPWLHNGQRVLPLVNWDDIEKTSSLGPTDDSVITDENSTIDNGDGFNNGEEYGEIDTVDDGAQMKTCVNSPIETVTNSV